MKKLIIFDLDGTLAKSKSAIDKEMAILFKELLEVTQVAIISGGDWPQFEKQVINQLPKYTSFTKLSILPTCGTKYYQYKKNWVKVYEEKFTDEERKEILFNLNNAIKNSDIEIKKTWGNQIEDRGSQITFSALGQEAHLEEKKAWDNDFAKRKKIVTPLQKSLKEFSIGMGGTTSIDITKPGIDKAYGILKLKEILKIGIDEMLFIGDALFEGGNDFPARSTGAKCIQVRDPEETKRIIETIIACETNNI
ncbi:HAD-IIB family hydrolase [Flavobacterium sp. P4023]|uniref:phosphomannomutase n=1 Tax=Flavobacterium flabelliforme TaxID=2816119 RepID=A0ABS5CWI4_9FLAO|nr:HAD-IIB family hydrolase [Flavobacterium flabelliforme]MBP4142975.1 HAD-IIB family hydrolase [Flavobacterium flabelliforme]